MRAAIRLLALALVVVLVPDVARAQDGAPDAPALVWHELALPSGATLAYGLAVPDDLDATAEVPVLLALAPRAGRAEAEQAFAARWHEAARAGFVVACPAIAPDASGAGDDRAALSALARALRLRFAVEHGRILLAGLGAGGRTALGLAAEAPHAFAGVAAISAPLAGLEAETFRDARWTRIRLIDRRHAPAPPTAAGADAHRQRAAALCAELVAAGLDARALDGDGPDAPTLPAVLAGLRPTESDDPARREAARALRDLHDAAARADAARYFGRFTDDAVFLGTDPDERWTIAAFRAWAAPWFERDSAWIYAPLEQHVTVDEGGAVAWFDEVVVNAGLGPCRGSGVLKRIDGRWRVALYDLTVPVRNDLVVTVAEANRRLGAAPADAVTVLLLRHAEKEKEGDDPELSAAGRARAANLAALLAETRITAAFSSPFRRTCQTLEPVLAGRDVSLTVMAPTDFAGLRRTLAADHGGGTVIVAGHSNTVPAIARALGVDDPPELSDDDHGDLLVIRFGAFGTSMIRLAF